MQRGLPPATAGGAAIPARTTGRSSVRSAASPRRPCCGRSWSIRSARAIRSSLTVNFCAPIAEGTFDLDVRLIKANRSTQHWSVELTQGGTDVATFATAVFAVRRPSWSHQPAQPPQAPSFEAVRPYPKSSLKMSWVRQYDFRFVEGEPQLGGAPHLVPASAFSKLWIGDTKPRPIDVLSLMSMSDAFFGRIFHVRNEFVPFGTVSLTTVFSRGRRRSRGGKHRARSSRWPTPRSFTRVLATRRASYGRRTAGCSRLRRRWRISRRKLRLTPSLRSEAKQSRTVVRRDWTASLRSQ